ncbi:MAG TPA: D-lyxose/D-mannose family sugar isomerase [Candidatus Atribacteria bacterium]|nr:D-lyxose/D-mannose family sugar isomerase [Candidatus Atribacteria bacterium]
MKRSEINNAVREAQEAFKRHHWYLPPNPKWDVTDFGLGDFNSTGLTSVNLAEQAEYCEKIMYVKKGQVTPDHYHASKKEDIICRYGRLAIQLYSDQPSVTLQVNGEPRELPVDRPLILTSGERITLVQGVRHAFWSDSEYTIVGEVSTANDDEHDNFFADPRVGRFSPIEEDEPAIVKLVSEK